MRVFIKYNRRIIEPTDDADIIILYFVFFRLKIFMVNFSTKRLVSIELMNIELMNIVLMSTLK